MSDRNIETNGYQPTDGNIVQHEEELFREFQAYVRSIYGVAYEQTAKQLHASIEGFRETVDELRWKIQTETEGSIREYTDAEGSAKEFLQQLKEQVESEGKMIRANWDSAISQSLQKFEQENILQRLERQQQHNNRRFLLLAAINIVMLAILLLIFLRR